eukprot:4622980-Pyramimonas_sp.AAC.1
MRFSHPVQLFVVPKEAPPKAQVAVSACVSPTQSSASWPHGELHRRPQWRCPCVCPTQNSASWPHKGAPPEAQRRCPHAVPPPSIPFRGPTRGLHLRPSCGVPMRSPSPSTALRGPIRSSTSGSTGGVHMRLQYPAQRCVTP